ncbi:hypothetical protein CFP65_5751 [Kitasatospora sp. MMS16-BH015]|uniref:hypothetical protein n=1 Tax=Kitasatospora sp. MMS16-BH015 TaxID=2018025 RepID=UPI000CA2A6BD|nr:hypothetical protein [Kitasatospora sp. MMS16-BH015]AUG80437.1 hypothetical protein CFP65_5751 [Kitasatospora sp. MMS16-BH015]
MEPVAEYVRVGKSAREVAERSGGGDPVELRRVATNAEMLLAIFSRTSVIRRAGRSTEA